jgi:hypothetical protein
MKTVHLQIPVVLIALFISAGLARTALAADSTDLQGMIDKQLQAHVKRIVIPPGSYRVTPHDRLHLHLFDLSDMEIIADGVEMICTQTTRALDIANCHNLHLRGLTIDYDPLPFTQGHIVALAPDKSWLEFKITDGYPDDSLEERIEIFDAKSRFLKRDTYYGWGKFQSLGDHRYRISKGQHYKFNPKSDLEEPGDILVTNNKYDPDGSAAHAVVIEKSSAVVLENVTVYSSNCFGYLEENCDATQYVHCRLDRRSLADDIVPRAEARVRSTDADAYHSAGAKKGPSLIGCVARFQGDDGVNIHGTYHIVTDSQGANLRVLDARPMAAGESVEILTYEGVRLPDAKVIAIKPDGKIHQDEHSFMAQQHMNATYLSPGWNPDAYIVTLDRPVDLPRGSVIASTSRMGNGFLVKDCNFSFNRSRGILIKASNGQVIGNTMEGNWGEAIKVSPEYWWLEAGSSANVVVSDNLVSNCKTTAIAIYANGGTGAIAPAGAHRNITVANNQVTASPLPNIVVTSTDILSMGDNRCTQSDGIVPKYVLKSLGLGDQEPAFVMTANCANVTQPAH